jgi:hypothetical protein
MADFDLVLAVWEGDGRAVGRAVENPWNLPSYKRLAMRAGRLARPEQDFSPTPDT